MIKKICNLLKKPFAMFKRQNFWIQLIIVFILFCVLQSLAYSAGFVEGLTNRDKKVLTYFHMSTCPHCIKFNPAWDTFVGSNKTGLATAKVEAGEMSEKHKALGVNGFPTPATNCRRRLRCYAPRLRRYRTGSASPTTKR